MPSQKFKKKNLFESQINLKDMGDGESIPMANRKSYLLDRNKKKAVAGGNAGAYKVTEVD